MRRKQSGGGELLLDACLEGNISEVRYLLRNGHHIESKDNKGITALHYAIMGGHLDIVELLISRGANKEAKDHRGQTPLHSSCNKKEYDIAKLLVNKGADINARETRGGFTPLQIVCSENNLEMVKFLVERGANKEVSDNDGYTPLLLMSAYGYVNIARYLIQQGANKTARANNYKTALDIARERNHVEIVGLLQTPISQNRVQTVSTFSAPILRETNNYNYFRLMRFGIEMEILHNFMLNRGNIYERNRKFAQGLNEYRKHVVRTSPDKEHLDRKYYHFLAANETGGVFPDNTAPSQPSWYKGHWVIDYDGSVTRQTANNANYNMQTEIISPPLSVWKKDNVYTCSDFGPNVLKNVVNHLMWRVYEEGRIKNIKYKNNKKCSMHIHISCIHESTNFFQNVTHLSAICMFWQLFEEVFLGLVDPYRLSSDNRRYYVNVQRVNPNTYVNEATGLTVNRVVSLVNGGVGRAYRYKTLNLQNLVDGYGTIEVRIHHGADDPKTMSYWAFLLTLFFNHVMTRALQTGSISNIAREVQSLERSLTTYDKKFNYLFNKIIKSTNLGTWYTSFHNAYYPENRVYYNPSDCDIIDDEKVNWILNLIFHKQFFTT
jgi:ankyrin repeat protein